MDMSQAIKEAGRKARASQADGAEVRNARVLAYLRSCIGKATPLNRELAEMTGLPAGVAAAALYQLRARGRITLKGNGNSRVIEIVGEGKTIARGNASVRAEVVKVEEPEPVRVDSWTCPRCGARSGNCAHTAIALSSRDVPAWRART